MKVVKQRSVSAYRGGGLFSSLVALPSKILNRTIDILPVELHIPGYQYCGPGTKLKERLARGDSGINKLDQACKEHDISYSKYSDSYQRSIADQKLADQAWQRVTSADANLGERATAYAVTNIMKLKNKFGGGKKNTTKKKKSCTTKKCLNEILKCLKKKESDKKKGKGYFLRPYKGGGSKKKKNINNSNS